MKGRRSTGGLALAASLVAAATAQEKITVGVGWQSDSFGYAIDLDGKDLFVGAFREDAGAIDSGAAYFLTETGGIWTERARLVPSRTQAHGWYGYDVALDGSRAAVAAPGRGVGTPERGAVFAYEEGGGVWQETGLLENDTGATDDLYGRAVALDGRRLVVGAPRDDTFQYDGGAIYVYYWSSGAWQLEAKLAAPGLGPFDYFGHAVAIEGDRLLASAYADDDAGVNAGAVYVFEREREGWVFVQKILGGAGTHHDNFGSSVALTRKVIAVGAPGSDVPLQDAGAAYVFERVGGVWVQTAILGAAEPGAKDGFGIAVAAHDDEYVVAGASHADVALPNDGAARVFKNDKGVWVPTLTLTAPDPNPYAYVGLDVSISADFVVAGAFGGAGAYPGEGAVYALPESVFTSPTLPVVPQLSWAQPFCFCAEARCGNPDPSGGCANSTGVGGRLAASGSPSVTVDDLVLSATGLLPVTPAKMYMGAPTVPVPLFSGQLCVGVGEYGRWDFPMQLTDAAGSLAYGPQIAAWSQAHFAPLGVIQAGQTWAFQVCYRDDDGACGWRVNWTNAVTVTFAP